MLMACKGCGVPVGMGALACPHCGTRRPTVANRSPWPLTIAALAFIAVVVWALI